MFPIYGWARFVYWLPSSLRCGVRDPNCWAISLLAALRSAWLHFVLRFIGCRVLHSANQDDATRFVFCDVVHVVWNVGVAGLSSPMLPVKSELAAFPSSSLGVDTVRLASAVR
jgi:hypothetical protein